MARTPFATMLLIVACAACASPSTSQAPPAALDIAAADAIFHDALDRSARLQLGQQGAFYVAIGADVAALRRLDPGSRAAMLAAPDPQSTDPARRGAAYAAAVRDAGASVDDIAAALAELAPPGAPTLDQAMAAAECYMDPGCTASPAVVALPSLLCVDLDAATTGPRIGFELVGRLRELRAMIDAAWDAYVIHVRTIKGDRWPTSPSIGDVAVCAPPRPAGQIQTDADSDIDGDGQVNDRLFWQYAVGLNPNLRTMMQILRETRVAPARHALESGIDAYLATFPELLTTHQTFQCSSLGNSIADTVASIAGEGRVGLLEELRNQSPDGALEVAAIGIQRMSTAVTCGIQLLDEAAGDPSELARLALFPGIVAGAALLVQTERPEAFVEVMGATTTSPELWGHGADGSIDGSSAFGRALDVVADEQRTLLYLQIAVVAVAAVGAVVGIGALAAGVFGLTLGAAVESAVITTAKAVAVAGFVLSGAIASREAVRLSWARVGLLVDRTPSALLRFRDAQRRLARAAGATLWSAGAVVLTFGLPHAAALIGRVLSPVDRVAVAANAADGAITGPQVALHVARTDDAADLSMLRSAIDLINESDDAKLLFAVGDDAVAVTARDLVVTVTERSAGSTPESLLAGLRAIGAEGGNGGPFTHLERALQQQGVRYAIGYFDDSSPYFLLSEAGEAGLDGPRLLLIRAGQASRYHQEWEQIFAVQAMVTALDDARPLPGDVVEGLRDLIHLGIPGLDSYDDAYRDFRTILTFLRGRIASGYFQGQMIENADLVPPAIAALDDLDAVMDQAEVPLIVKSLRAAKATVGPPSHPDFDNWWFSPEGRVHFQYLVELMEQDLGHSIWQNPGSPAFYYLPGD